jgi:DNA (cytosine-5)-methyltransferase 1
MKAKKLTYIDLFAGCGGLSLGLEKAGFHLELAVEKSEMACQTFYHNLIKPLNNQKEWEDYCALSIEEQASRKLVVNTIREVLDNKKIMKELRAKEVDLLAGGPPCQGFSMAGRRNPEDARNQLPWQFMEFIEKVNPKAVIMENVVGISRNFNKHDVKSPLQQLTEVLKTIGVGYEVQPVELNTMNYGIPQHRPRIMLLALRKDVAKKLKMNFSPDMYKSSYDLNLDVKNRPDIVPIAKYFSESMKSVEDAIWDLGETDYKYKITDKKYLTKKAEYAKFLREYTLPMHDSSSSANIKLKNQTERKHSEDVKMRFRVYQFLNSIGIKHKLFNIISKPDLTNKDKVDILSDYFTNLTLPIISSDKVVVANSKKDLIDLIIKLGTKKHSQRAIDLKKPSPTIVTLPDDYVHPISPRILTVREMARIQSFPDVFEFKGKETTGGTKRRTEVPQYTQVGNAVAPLLAFQLGKNFKKILES